MNNGKPAIIIALLLTLAFSPVWASAVFAQSSKMMEHAHD